jgi:hypothetical protein
LLVYVTVSRRFASNFVHDLIFEEDLLGACDEATGTFFPFGLVGTFGLRGGVSVS